MLSLQEQLEIQSVSSYLCLDCYCSGKEEEMETISTEESQRAESLWRWDVCLEQQGAK